MTTMIIEENSVQAQRFIQFARTLPFATVVETESKSFEEAVAECDGISVDAFFDKLDKRIKERFNA